MKKKHTLASVDSAIYNTICAEEMRQQTTLNLIASENYTHPAVLEAVGSVLSGKYAEGYPGKRYYAGCEHVDTIESITIERCKNLFGVNHANVQPHSGASANFSVLTSMLKPGDTLIGMSLDAGGHLTHGHKVNASGTLYRSFQYGVTRDTETLDYDLLAQLAEEHKPRLIIAGASAYARTIDFKRIREIAQSVNAFFMADIAHIAGLIVAKIHPSPVGYADIITSTTHKTLRGPRGGLIMCNQEHAETIDRSVMPGTQGGPAMHTIAGKAVCFKLASQPDFIEYQKQVVANAKALAKLLADRGYRIVSGDTDTHLFVVDLRSKNVTGRQAEKALETAGIVASRSAIPYDTNRPWNPSGIRFGTPALTTMGVVEADLPLIAALIDEAIQAHDDEKKLRMLYDRVTQFMQNLTQASHFGSAKEVTPLASPSQL